MTRQEVTSEELLRLCQTRLSDHQIVWAVRAIGWGRCAKRAVCTPVALAAALAILGFVCVARVLTPRGGGDLAIPSEVPRRMKWETGQPLNDECI